MCACAVPCAPMLPAARHWLPRPTHSFGAGASCGPSLRPHAGFPFPCHPSSSSSNDAPLRTTLRAAGQRPHDASALVPGPEGRWVSSAGMLPDVGGRRCACRARPNAVHGQLLAHAGQCCRVARKCVLSDCGILKQAARVVPTVPRHGPASLLHLARRRQVCLCSMVVHHRAAQVTSGACARAGGRRRWRRAWRRHCSCAPATPR